MADKNAAKKPSARLSDNVKSIEEAVINTNAKAVKWNEEKSMKKKKYFYTGREDSNDIRDELSSQSLRDRQAKDKMLSDEESKIYFYTTTKFMDQSNNNQNFRTYNYRSDGDQEESILEKFLLKFERLHIDCHDHLYIYDGAHATGSFRVSYHRQ